MKFPLFISIYSYQHLKYCNHMTRDWTDLNRQGRGMAAIVAFCKTMVKKEAEKDTPNHDLIMGYMDRQIKASHHQSQLTDMVLGIKMIRKLAEKKYLDVIVEDKLRALK